MKKARELELLSRAVLEYNANDGASTLIAFDNACEAMDIMPERVNYDIMERFLDIVDNVGELKIF